MKLMGQQAEVRRPSAGVHSAPRVCLPALRLPPSPKLDPCHPRYRLLQAQPPHLEKNDAWGNQLDTLLTADAWKQLKALSGGCCSKPARAAKGAWGLRLLSIWQTPFTMLHHCCS